MKVLLVLTLFVSGCGEYDYVLPVDGNKFRWRHCDGFIGYHWASVPIPCKDANHPEEFFACFGKTKTEGD